MRAPNFYAHPGFERAGLRRRDTDWILERIADPGSLFVPVWRNQNLVFELDDAEPRAVVLPSTAVAAGMSRGPGHGLRLIDELGASGALDRYHLYHAARADMLRRLGARNAAVEAYQRALELTANGIERMFLERRLAAL